MLGKLLLLLMLETQLKLEPKTNGRGKLLHLLFSTKASHVHVDPASNNGLECDE
jgi:hypothetical protein